MSASYEAVARIYDALAQVYSLGAIRRAKASAAALVSNTDHVLIVGAGTATEAPDLIARGARVTLLDSSVAMLERARLRCGDVATLTLHAGRLEDFAVAEPFDIVLAPFFLNTYGGRDVPSVLARLAAATRIGGQVIVVDFAAPRRGWFGGFQRLHYLPPLLLFRWLTGNPWHELYDYAAIAGGHPIPLRVTNRIPTRAFGLPLYETISFRVVGKTP